MKKNSFYAFLIILIFTFSSCTYRVHVDTRQYRKGFYITIASEMKRGSSSLLNNIQPKDNRMNLLRKDSLVVPIIQIPVINIITENMTFSTERIVKKCPHDTIVPRSHDPKRRPDWMGITSLVLAALATTIHVSSKLPNIGIVLLWLLVLILTFIFAGVSLRRIKKYPKNFKWRFIAIVAMSVAGISFVIAALRLLGIWQFFVELFS